MPNINTRNKRGRPRAFDERAVIEHAAGVFLDQGFESVSYEQLGKEIGLSKPSLYNTFGDKTAFFERVLDSYAQHALSMAKAEFQGKENLQIGVSSYLHGAAEIYSKQNALSQGCLLIGTALPACTQPGTVRKILTDFVVTLEDTLEQIVEAEYIDDARKLGRSPRHIAMLLGSVVFSLAIRARTGLSSEKLHEAANELSEAML